MASKKTHGLGQLDELKIDDIQFPGDGGKEKKDRKPIERIASGFAAGAKQKFTDKAFISRTVKDALPKGYGAAFNAADSAVRGARELYNSAAQELRPLTPIMQKATNAALPKVRTFLPKSVADSLDRFAKGSPKYKAPTQADYDNQEISGSIAEIFKIQMTEQARQHAVSQTSDALRQQIADKRMHKQQFHLLGIHRGMDRLVAYQDQITSKYHQKSLELQYRSYFTLRDMLKLQAEDSGRMKAQLDAIVKNTGLPDTVKVRHSEQYGSTLRDKLYGRSQQAIVDYIGKFGGKFKQNLLNSVRSAASGFAGGVQGARDLHEMDQMMAEFGHDTSAWHKGGDFAGSLAADIAGRKAGHFIRSKLNKVKPVKRFGDRLGYFVDTGAERANRWAKSDQGDYGKAGSLVRFLKDLMPRFAQSTALGESPILNADQATHWDNQSKRSLNEVIPGFLSRIYQELQIMRTGDQSIKPTVYNMDRGQFTSKSQASSDAMGRVMNKQGLEMTHYGLNNVLSTIDPKNRLPEHVRHSIKRQLLADSGEGRAFDPHRWANSNENLAHIDPAHRQKIADLAKRRYFSKNGEINYGRASTTSTAMRSLSAYAINPTAAMQAYLQTGNRELLEEAGLISKVGMADHVNLGAVFDHILGYQAGGAVGGTPSAGPSSSGPSRPFPSSPTAGPSGKSGPSAMDRLRQGASSIGGKFRWLGERASDLYLAGATKASILADDLMEGKYFSAITGAPISTLEQLRDGVVDAAGKVVISAQQAAAGLTDKINAGRQAAAMMGAVGLVGAPISRPAAPSMAPTTSTTKPAEAEEPTRLEELIKIIQESDEHRTQESHGYMQALAEIMQIVATVGGGGKMSPEDMTRFGLFGKWGGKAVGGVAKGIGWAARGMGQYFKHTYGLIGKTFGAAAAGLGGIVGGTRDFLSDVYVKGQWRPALYAKKMRNGDYRDQKTGKVIKKLRQIKGPVIDEMGNVVLSDEDYAAGLYDSRGRALFKGLASGVWGGINAVGKFYGAMFNLPMTVLKLAGRGVGAAMNFAKRPQDVYTPDDLQTPKLYASIMGAGRYFNVKDNTKVMKPRDIKGEVYEITEAGEKVVRLNAEQMKNGICNFRGKPFKTLVGRLLGVAGGVVRGLGSIVGKGIKAVGSFIGMGYDILAGTFKRIGGIFNPKVFEVYSTKSTKLLQGILNVLTERLPKPEHIRAGSWEDQLKHKGGKVVDKDGKPIAATGAAGGGLLAWLKSKLGKKDEEEGDHDGMDASDLIGSGAKKGTFGRNASAWMKRLGRKLGRSKLGRLVGRFGSRIANSRLGGAVGRIASRIGGSRIGGALLKGGGGLVRGAGGLLRVGGGVLKGAAALAGIGEGAGALSAIGGGLATAATGVGTAVAGTASAIGGGLAAAGSAIGGVISAPVLLGAAAIAAAGYGIYKGVQYYNLKKSQPLRKVRMAQYGVDIGQSVWPMQKILELEDKLKDAVSIGPSGATIGDKGYDPADLPKIFGLDPSWWNPKSWFSHSDESDDRHKAWQSWFENRFKPVFCAWMAAKAGVAGGKIDLSDLDDKASPDDKTKMLTAADGIDANIYSMMDSPFEDPLTATASTVSDAMKEAKDAVEVEKKKGGSQKGAEAGVAAAATGVVAKTALDKLKTGTDNSAAAATAVSKTEAAKAAGLAAAISGNGGSLDMKATSNPKAVLPSSTLSALLAVRLKTYGLIKFSVDRVKALYVLEQDILPNLEYDSNGLASYSDDPYQLFTKYAGVFGLSADDAAMKVQWIDWYSNRFCPVLLSFASAVKAANKNVDPGNAEGQLAAAQLLDVANAIISTTTRIKDSSVSVWTATTSPWDDQPLNTDSKSTDENINALKNAIKQAVLDQEQAKLQASTDKLKNGSNPQATASAGAATAQASVDATATARVKMAGGGGTADFAATGGGGASASVGGGAPGQPVGQTIKQPGNGTGGDINKIPNPAQGATGWDAMKPTIVAAANMAGMDPGVMATFADIESGFNPSIKAGTSSATGLFQFTNGTWQSMLLKYGAKYGIDPKTPATDPRANALMAAEFIKENRDYLKRRLNRDPTDTELYLAHFLGAGGAASLLKADPNSIAAAANAQAAAANKSIFYDKNGSPRSVKDVVALMDSKVRKHSNFDVSMSKAELASAQDNGMGTGLGGGAGSMDVQKAGGGTAPGATPATPASPAGGSTSTDAGSLGGGYGGALASAAAGSATTQAGGPSSSAPFASANVPDISNSPGMSLPTPSKAGSQPDAVIDQQRQVKLANAAVADAAGKQANDANNANLDSMSSMMSDAVKALKTLVDLTQQQVSLLGGIHGNTADTVAAVNNGSDDNGTNNDASQTAGTRGRTPFSAGAPQVPVSVKRGISRAV